MPKGQKTNGKLKQESVYATSPLEGQQDVENTQGSSLNGHQVLVSYGPRQMMCFGV